MNPPTQRRLAAIVSADVVGYSRLMGIDEAGTLAALRAHRSALIDPKISDHGGRIVKTMGDGLLLEFPSVVDATVCAIEVQEAMTARNAEVEEGKRIVFRIGVHVGDIIIDGEDILGDGVNIAARVEALAEPGGVAITGRVHDDVMDRLEVSFSDTGERSLKNIARPVRVWQWKPKESPTVRTVEASALPDIPAVAVLPFKNMSRDPEQDYFSDGISEELITELSRYRDFRVLSRSSTSAFKDQSVDPVQVAQKLGVRFVVEGSVRRAGRRIRVNAQLTEGKTGNHIWAERYDREMEDIFEVQDDIARTIASTLGGRIVDDSVTRSLKKNSNEVDAYDLTLQSNAYFLQLNPESNRKSRDLALRAIELAPDFARAHAALSFSHTFDVIQLWGEEPTESMKVALDAAIMATSLDDKDEPSNAALGFAELFSGNHDRAIEVSQKAIRLNPNHADAHARLAIAYSYSGQADESLIKTEHAMRLNPHYPNWYGIVYGRAQYITGDYAGAERSIRDLLSSTPTYPAPRAILIATLVALGKQEEAETQAAILSEIAPNYRLRSLRTSHPCRVQTELDTFLTALRRAGIPE